MAESSLWWTTNGTGDGAASYTQAQVVAWLRRTFLGGNSASQGVLRGYANELAVTGATSPIAVATGAAYVYGFPYENDTSASLAVTTPSVGTTGGRVVLRVNWAAQTVRLIAVRNTDGVAAIPALTQAANTTWEISLATFSITTGGVITLTDTRSFVEFASNHLKRLGDTLLGKLTISTGATGQGDDLEISSTLPDIRLNDTDGASNAKIWDILANANVFSLLTRTDAGAAGASAMDITRSGTTVSQVNFPSGASSVKSGGNTMWHAGNDGAASGLDADLLDGAQGSQYARLDAAGNFTTAPTISSNAIWHAGNDGDASGLDADKIAGLDLAPLRRLGGSATDWTTPGTTSYTPAAARIQCGTSNVVIANGNQAASLNVTFPTAFSQPPVVVAISSQSGVTINTNNLIASQVQLDAYRPGTSGPLSVNMWWIAIGPT